MVKFWNWTDAESGWKMGLFTIQLISWNWRESTCPEWAEFYFKRSLSSYEFPGFNNNINNNNNNLWQIINTLLMMIMEWLLSRSFLALQAIENSFEVSSWRRVLSSVFFCSSFLMSSSSLPVVSSFCCPSPSTCCCCVALSPSWFAPLIDHNMGQPDIVAPQIQP